MAFEFDINNIKWQSGSHGLPECVYKIKVPSVTQIINECIPDPDWDAFIAQVGKEKADDILMKAGQRGTSMHTFIEEFIVPYSKSNDISEALKLTQENTPKLLLEQQIPENKIKEGMDYFYKFYYSNYSTKFFNLLAVEMGIFSPSLFYRGKLDILYKDNLFGISLTDLKSSNDKVKKGSIKEYKHFLQLGAYANCLDEMYKDKGLIIKNASILNISKKTDELQEIVLSGTNLTDFKEKFKTLIRDYHIKNNQEYLL
jgi:hypothetical protein